jgi:signal transduction histidine kinase
MTGSIEHMQGTHALPREQLERRIRERDELIATIAHDLRTPLNTMIGWVQLLRSGAARDPKLLAEGLEVVERSARLQTRLVADFAEASRLASGKAKLSLRPVSLRAIIDAAVASLDRAVRVEPRLPPEEMRLEADPEHLARALSLLLARAAENASGAPVLVEAERRSDAAEIRISPPSCGSAGLESAAARTPGTTRVEGLDAFFVRSVLELHGGELRPAPIDAHPAFVVTLPLTEAFASR